MPAYRRGSDRTVDRAIAMSCHPSARSVLRLSAVKRSATTIRLTGLWKRAHSAENGNATTVRETVQASDESSVGDVARAHGLALVVPTTSNCSAGRSSRRAEIVKPGLTPQRSRELKRLVDRLRGTDEYDELHELRTVEYSHPRSARTLRFSHKICRRTRSDQDEGHPVAAPPRCAARRRPSRSRIALGGAAWSISGSTRRRQAAR